MNTVQPKYSLKDGILPSLKTETQGAMPCCRERKNKRQRITPLPLDCELSRKKIRRGLLEFGLQIGRSTVRNFNFEFGLLALADKRMPGNNLVLARRHVLDLEGPVFFYHGKVRA